MVTNKERPYDSYQAICSLCATFRYLRLLVRRRGATLRIAFVGCAKKGGVWC